MAFVRFALFGVILCGLACSSSGQTGSPGAAECLADADCEEEARSRIDSAEIAIPVTFRNAICSSHTCGTTFVTEAGCSPALSGPYYDCALDDAMIREQYRVDSSEDRHPDRVPYCVEYADGGLASCYDGCKISLYCREAAACVDGACGPCTTDSECVIGESCVLGHCVRAGLVECHLDADCAGGAACVLGEYTRGTARGNEDLRAYCLTSSDAGR